MLKQQYISYICMYVCMYVCIYMYVYICMYIYIRMAQRSNAGQGILILEISRQDNCTPQSVRLLWTNDQLVAETST